MNPYIEKVYLSKMEQSHKLHQSVVKSFCDISTAQGKKIMNKLDTEITQNDYD